jgi:hypothetical protein
MKIWSVPTENNEQRKICYKQRWDTKLRVRSCWGVKAVVSAKVCVDTGLSDRDVQYSDVSCAMSVMLIRVIILNVGVLSSRRSLSLSFKHGIKSLLLGQSVNGRILRSPSLVTSSILIF